MRWRHGAWLSGIHFVLVESADADIRFSHVREDGSIPNTAVVHTDSRGLTIYSALVIVPEDRLERNSALSIFLHEIGHALGLNHPGEYARYDTVFEDHALFANDSHQATVMSYFSQSRNPNINQIATGASPVTPQIADIIAIQLLYGKPAVANAGDTTYGVGANTGTYMDDYFARWTGTADGNRDSGGTFTLYDTDGYDTLDISTDPTDQRIDLSPEGISDVYTTGSLGTLIIARDTIIERYVAGSGDDNVTGNVADNLLEGRDGADTLMGGLGNDRLMGGAGADVLVGGPGNDAAYYASSAAAVTVNLLDGTGTGGDAEGDTLDSIENLSGSAFDDTITGNARNNVLSGRAGADTLDGGDGTDTVSYSGSSAGVTVNLLTGVGARGDAQGDMLSNIENLIGSPYNDALTGDTGNNVLRAGAGDDVLIGGAGADRLRGGTGQDTVSYTGSTEGVTVRLHSLAAGGGDATGDTFPGLVDVAYTDANGVAQLEPLPDVERLTGSAHNDILAGDARDNVIDGGFGDDTLYGGPGGGDDELSGGPGNDRLFGGQGDDTLVGGPGADRFYGGSGQDTVSYTGSPEGVTVRLHSLAAKGGDARGDTFESLVDVAYTDANGVAQTELPAGRGAPHRLSAHDDILAGDRRDNDIDSGAGNDTLYGGPGGGDDVMNGGLGDDRLFGGQGEDTPHRRAWVMTGWPAGPGMTCSCSAPGTGADTVTDFSGGTDKIDLTAFDIESIDEVSMTTGDEGVTLDLAGIDGGTVLLADLTVLPDAGDFVV